MTGLFCAGDPQDRGKKAKVRRPVIGLCPGKPARYGPDANSLASFVEKAIKSYLWSLSAMALTAWLTAGCHNKPAGPPISD